MHPAAPAEPTRLSKRVAQLLACSRSEAEAYIEGGWVRVENQVVEEPPFKVAPQQVVTVDPGATLISSGPVTMLLHKPVGMDSGAQHEGGARPAAVKDARLQGGGMTTLAQACLLAPTLWSNDRSGLRPLKKHLKQLTIAPPLPREASGLLVFTQDWRIARKLIEDASTLEQEVMAEVRTAVSPEQLARLCHGLSFNGRALPPIRVSINSQNPEQTRLRFALKGVTPGQIPSMCHEVGLTLLALKRTRVGRVPLSDLPVGQWRFLLAQEKF